MSTKRRPLVFHTASYQYMAEALVATGHFLHGQLEQRPFPDGESYHRLLSPINQRDIILVGGTVTDADTLDLFDLGCALSKYGARTLSMVLPYFGYSTMERAVKMGEVVKAKTRARLLSGIPQAVEGNTVYLLDLHSEGIPHYFEGRTTTRHVYCKDLIAKLARRLAGKRNFVLGSTDAGRAKWVESLASDMGVTPAIILKRRISATETKVTGVSADVDGETVVMYDDMIRTGGTAMKAAQKYREFGAAKVFLVATHGVLPGGALDKLTDSGLFNGIACTDTHPRAVALQGAKLTVEPVSELLASELRTKL
jgi:ribose-phosphate pyrophosphokinase